MLGKNITLPLGLVSLSLLLSLFQNAHAELPVQGLFSSDLKQAIQAIEPSAQIRQDGWVHFDKRGDYALVSPSESIAVPSVKLIEAIPQGQMPPDILWFNDGHYLLRMIDLPGGRQAFPFMENIPDDLKTGMLSPYIKLPKQFLIPTVWKSITGNLLAPESTHAVSKNNYPLLVVSEDSQTLTSWDLAKGVALGHYTLPCKKIKTRLDAEASKLYLGCQDQATLAIIDFTTGQIEHYPTPQPIADLILDTDHHRVLLAHKTLAVLSVLDTETRQFLAPIPLIKPAYMLAQSQYRKQVYAASEVHRLTPAEMQISVEPRHFIHRNAYSQPKRNKQEPPTLQIVSLLSNTVEKQIPALWNLEALHVEDEKMLWMVSNQDKTLQGFDLRWQEYTKALPLVQPIRALADEDGLLFVLNPGEISRYEIKTKTWLEPIALESKSEALGLALDEDHQLLYVLSSKPKGLQIINLTRQAWSGTQAIDLDDASQLILLSSFSQAKQARIKFQDGRFLPQNALADRWVKSLSAPHDPQKTRFLLGKQGSSPKQTPPETKTTP
jgi:hypothetical protein